MRRLVWLAIGLCGGCALRAYGLENEIGFPVAIAFALVAVLFFCLKKQKVSLVGIGLALGIFYTAFYCHSYLRAVTEFDGTEQPITITATDYSAATDYGLSCEGEITLLGRQYDVLFYIYDEITLNPGDQVTGTFLLRMTTPGGSKESTYHQGNGIVCIAYSRGEVSVTPGEEQALKYLPQRLRKAVLSRLEAIFPEDTAGFAKALLLGETDDLAYLQDTAFQESGIRHIVAVSGLHVSILFALIFLLSGKKPYLTAIFGIPALILFAFMAGLSPSIVRACVMQGVMILALLLKREYDPPSALALAVLVILLGNPFSVVSVSFQLSCGCIVGIFLFTGRLQKYFYRKFPGFSVKAKILQAIGAAVSVTVGTMIVTVPLCAYYFGVISLIGVLTNLLTLWAVSIIFYGIVACCTLSLLWMPVAQILGGLISLLMRYVLMMAELCSKIPFAAVYTASPYILVCLVLCYGLFALFWFGGRKHLMLTAGAMAVLLVLSTAFSYIEPRLDNYRITVLDVGQGQCVLLQSKGQTYMVDCGGSGDKTAANTAVRQLLSQGIDHIDGVILTHYDNDHVGGISYFLQRIQVDTLYLPKEENSFIDFPETQNIVILSEIREFNFGVAKLTLIPGLSPEKPNENSTCVLFQAQGCDILITGDRGERGELLLLQQIDLPKLEYLVAGHHGAETSTTALLLAKTQPETVIISVGQNFYGHPHEQTLERIRSDGGKILRTDHSGTIIIRG